jgi:uncharacterized membrane protein (UPF0127 family)
MIDHLRCTHRANVAQPVAPAPLAARPPGTGNIWHTASMAWLVSDARVLASAEVADTRRARRRGLLGRDGLDGALVIERCRWIHTIGMRFPIDVAYLDSDGIVVKTMHMNRYRLGIPVWRASWVIEAEGGAFGRWGLRVGDEVELRRHHDNDNDNSNDHTVGDGS